MQYVNSLMPLNHILSIDQFLDREVIGNIFQLTEKLEQDHKKKKLKQSMKRKILATLFYEPSTRTRISFESAMQKLGGSVITTELALLSSSASKGESLEDTIKVISQYVDAIVLRHSKKGSATHASLISKVPIINAGDGAGEHPTQALLDLYTIKKELGKLDDIKIALVGDLLYGRTTHSLIKAISIYDNIKIFLISPTELKLPEEYKNFLKTQNMNLEEMANIEPILNEIDILYITRIQKERFASLESYGQLKDSYMINKKTLSKLKEHMIIMHPLPRVGEIHPEIDSDKRAAYFRQAENGLYIRMALLQMVLK